MTRTLERALAQRVRGGVRFDDGTRALYATDASNYRRVPLGVVTPRDDEDVVAALQVCAELGAPVLPRGGGTSLAGQCVNHAVVLDFSRHLRAVVALDPDRRTARVQPGAVLDDLRHQAERFGLTFGPDPATHGWCTLGGMIGNNSCGVHSVYTGRTADNVLSLRTFTVDGREHTLGSGPDAVSDPQLAASLRAVIEPVAPLIRDRYPRIPRRVSGYNLDELLPERGFHVARSVVGSEGTCVVLAEATVALAPWSPHRVLVVVGYPTVFEAADHVVDILEVGPVGLEGIDEELVSGMAIKNFRTADLELLPEGRGWLLVEVAGDTPDEAREKAESLARRIPAPTRVWVDPTQQERLWAVREAGLAATARIPGRPDTWPGWEDSAVAPSQLGSYLRGLQTLLDRYGYRAALYGHFGDGCVHSRIPFGLRDDAGIRTFRDFLEEASDLVLAHGGSLSGEHGDGQARSALLGKMYGPALTGAFAAFKRVWDPEGRLNPGRIVNPAPITHNLRVAHVPVLRPRTTFAYRDDGGSLSHATERCVGVGKCRGFGTGTMCPSYRATLAEEHSTRGRAHLLYEMLRADSPISSEQMSNRAVFEALDLCLSCKGCKSDCPMGVDVATYKAEFTHRWYRGRVRPRIAYLFGFMPWTARWLSRVAPVVNWLTRFRWVRRLIGVHPDRPIPSFAGRTWRAQLRHQIRVPEGEPVALWIDSWTDHFHPEVGRAAVAVLERLGFRVEVPPWACCGRPLYDYGMLGPARRALRRCLRVTRPYVAAGAPLVVLEPSCASVFRDELTNLFPDDPWARDLAAATRTMAELLRERRPELAAAFDVHVKHHGHCHHKAVLGTGPDVALLEQLGASVDVVNVGCCGMSGIFGYERSKYDVSRAVGETGVLPVVRGLGPDEMVCADGFSCRTQIRDFTGRRAVHLAEVLERATREPR